MNQTDIDVSHLVDAVFDQAECSSASKNKIPCGGTIRAYSTAAHCGDGFLCETHYNHYLTFLRPRHIESYERKGFLRCPTCKFEAYVFDDYVKVYPL